MYNRSSCGLTYAASQASLSPFAEVQDNHSSSHISHTNTHIPHVDVHTLTSISVAPGVSSAWLGLLVLLLPKCLVLTFLTCNSIANWLHSLCLLFIQELTEKSKSKFFCLLRGREVYTSSTSTTDTGAWTHPLDKQRTILLFFYYVQLNSLTDLINITLVLHSFTL